MSDRYSNTGYLSRNEGWHAEDSPYKARLCIDMLEKNAVAPSTIADVGCGAGRVAERLASRFPGAAVTGYDISADAVRLWEDRAELPNLKYVGGDFLDIGTPVECVLCLDVFEHVEDYFGFLRSLARKCDHVIFNIPLDLNLMKVVVGLKQAREQVGHLHYFNTYTALETLKDTGYDIVDWHHSAAFFGMPPRNVRQWCILPLRLLTAVFGLQVAATVFGGVSLVVLARSVSGPASGR